jgi:hypothetical protein
MLGIDSWAPLEVYKYGLGLQSLAELVPWMGLLKVKKFGLCMVFFQSSFYGRKTILGYSQPKVPILD